MSAAWMVYGVAVGSLAVGVAALLYALRHDSGRSVRWIWAGAMAITVALTAVAPLRTEAPAPSMVQAVAGSVVVATPEHGTPSLGVRLREAFDGITHVAAWPLRAAVSSAAQLPPVAQRAATIVTVLAAVLGLLTLLVVYARVMKLRATWKRVALLGVTVRVAPAAGPAVVGVAPAEIVIPDWLLQRTIAEQQLVLEHEQSHVRAGDPLLLLSACVAVACMPWNPALWYMLARLRLAVEVDCDRRVLRAGAPTRSYAQLLIELSQHRSLLSPAMPAFSHTASHLERRLLAMTARPSRTSAFARLGTLLLASVALLAACESKLPTSAEIDDMTAAGATARAGSYVKLDTARVAYVVNGKQVTKLEAEKIDAGRIASIDVKGAQDSGKSEVRIRTIETAVSGDTVMLRRRTDTTVISAGTVKLRASTSGEPFNGLLLVDGVIKDGIDLKSLNPDRIASIEVIKGAAAASKYSDPRAANGVIAVTLKK